MMEGVVTRQMIESITDSTIKEMVSALESIPHEDLQAIADTLNRVIGFGKTDGERYRISLAEDIFETFAKVLKAQYDTSRASESSL